MSGGNLIGRTARLAASGALGVLVVEGGKKVLTRGVAVSATTVALRGKRRAEVVAEQVRLSGADVVSEARARIGEQSPVPAADAAHDHSH